MTTEVPVPAMKLRNFLQESPNILPFILGSILTVLILPIFRILLTLSWKADRPFIYQALEKGDDGWREIIIFLHLHVCDMADFLVWEESICKIAPQG